MLTLSKKTDYALIALAHLAEDSGRVASARDIAAQLNLPAPLLMNLLKQLNHHGILRSSRGVNGGYQINISASNLSLYDLIRIVDGRVQLNPCGDASACKVGPDCPLQGPIAALHHRLTRFLREVTLADLMCPGLQSPYLARREHTPADRAVAMPALIEK